MKNILITGATGHLGGIVIAALRKQVPAQQVFALVRDEAKASALKADGINLRVGSYGDKAALKAAMQGIDQVLLISSSDLDDRFGQHKNVVDAAKEAGVKHILYTSVTIDNLENSALKPFLGSHVETEAYILASGLNYTFLRNGLYFEVIPMFAGANVLDTGIFFPSGAGKVAFASRADLGEAAANILLTDGHENKAYALTNTVSSSFGDVAAALSELAGKEVPFISPDSATFEATLKQFGLPEPIIGMSLMFAAGIQNNEFASTDATLEGFLGRKQMDLKTFLKETYHL